MIKVTHGRRGQSTEFYEYTLAMPKVGVQRYGAQWFLGVTHTDGTWQVAGYFLDLPQAKTLARALAERYAATASLDTAMAVRLAKEFVTPLSVTGGSSR